MNNVFTLRHQLDLGGGGSLLLPETKAYIAAVKAEGGEILYEKQVNELLKTLKTNGILQKLDFLYLANYEGIGSRVNIISPSVMASIITGISFSSKKGWQSPGVGQCLNLGYKRSTMTKLVAPKGSIGVFFTETQSDKGRIFMGAMRSASSPRNSLLLYRASPATRIVAELYRDAENAIAGMAASSNGYFAFSHHEPSSGVYAHQLYMDTVRHAANNTSYTSIHDVNIYGCAANINGVVSTPMTTTGRIGCFYAGDYIDGLGADPAVIGGEHAIFRSALAKYFTDIAEL